MKIYTTYFANLRKLPETIVPVSICARPPKGWRGSEYKPLAPTYNILMSYKQNHDELDYVKQYKTLVLNKLHFKDVVEHLQILSAGRDIALVCYEKSEDFCHRHLVADWFKSHGYYVEEW